MQVGTIDVYFINNCISKVIVNSVVSAVETTIVNNSTTTGPFTVSNLTSPTIKPAFVNIWARNFGVNNTRSRLVTAFNNAMTFEHDPTGTGSFIISNFSSANAGVVGYSSNPTETLLATVYVYYL
jgi:hypothetical protein